MPTLWLAQREFGWLSEPVMEYVAELMELPLAWVTSVASFYTMYWQEPTGAMAPAGVPQPLVRAARRRRAPRRDPADGSASATARRTADGRFSLEEVECLGSLRHGAGACR